MFKSGTIHNLQCCKESLMQKSIPLIFILALFLVTCITACGGGSTTATAQYKTPTIFTNNTGATLHLMGGARQQGTALNLSGTVTTLAGTAGKNGVGFSNYTGNSSATAMFNQPNDVTTDGIDFYVADYQNSVIRRIYTVSGEVRTSTLQCIDKTTNAAITFLLPTGITADTTNLYVVDRGYNCIRVITIAPNSSNQHEVVTIGSTSGVAGYVDSITDKTTKITTDKSTVLFNQPVGITTDGVNVYVADYGNATVRWFNTSNVVTDKSAAIHDNYAVYTLAGTAGGVGSVDGGMSADGSTSTALFNLPTRITTDGKSLFVTDFFNRTIRKIAIATGAVTTLAGSTVQLSPDNIGSLDGPGLTASFRQPDGITTDGINLYVTDSYLNIIRVIDKNSGNVTTLKLPSSDSLHTPLGLTTDGVRLLVADTYTLFRDANYNDIVTYSNSILGIQ
jgi:hypothetical protein